MAPYAGDQDNLLERKTLLARQGYVQAEIIPGREEGRDLFVEVVGVDHQAGHARRGQAPDDQLQHGRAVHVDQGLGQAVGQRAQAEAEARREHDGFHLAAPISLCDSSTRTPYFFFSRSASASAQ